MSSGGSKIARVPSVQRSLTEIAIQLELMRLRASSPEADLLRTAPNVSAWCPAQHLDHLARSSTSILKRLTTPAPAGRGITLVGWLVLRIGWIPRGRGKSPEKLHGTPASSAALLASFDEMERLVKSADAPSLERSRIPVVRHPKFGGLTPSQALRFVSIHNVHHLRIIEDIART